MGPIGAGMGLLNGGIDAAMGVGQLKKQKRVLELGKQNERLQEQAQLGQIQQEGQQTQHGEQMAEGNILGEAGDRGLGDSSIPQGQIKESQYQTGQRMQALQRQQNLITNTQGNQEQIWNIQRNMSRAQNQMKLIGGFLQGGASGGMGAMGGLG